jgi:hypothetical protein
MGLGLSLLCALPLFPQEDGAPEPWMDLPDDPIGRLWASVGENTEPWRPEGDAAALTWNGWAAALNALTPLDPAAPAEPSGPTGQDSAERRDATAFLVRFAVEDERPEDAFRWLAGLGADDPEALAGLLPLLFPGVPPEIELLAGGHIPPLPAGIMLRPQLPPMPRSEAARRLSRRATCRGLVIGESTVDLILKVDGSGVVAEFIHRGGPAATLVVQLPRPDGMRLKQLYVDWDVQTPPEGSDPETFDWATTPIQFTIQPQATGEDSPGYAESFSVFARLDFVRGGIPRTPPGSLPHALIEGGLELVVDEPDSDGSAVLPWKEVAAAWGAASGLPITVSSGDPKAQEGPAVQGTVVGFRDRPDPKLLARQITGAIEERRRQDHLLYR